MNKPSILFLVSLSAIMACAEETAAPAATNAPAAPATISIQEMLVIGPSGLKLHSLAMITQGKVQGEVDASFLPGLKACSEDPALPVRSVTARLIGQYFIQGKETPNPEALDLLLKLSKDESPDVRYNAVYHGLAQLENKSDEILNRLIDIAATDREQSLYERIAKSLEKDHERVARILDQKLADGDNVAIYEIYEDLAGQQPPHSEKYLDMPSSRPRLFIFKGEGADPETYRSELEKALQNAGVEHPTVSVSGAGENYVLLLKTYITKDNLTVETSFSDHPKFPLTQSMWLTSELEVQIEAMQKQKK